MGELSNYVIKRLEGRQPSEHPDLDLIGAFVERSLSKAERTKVLRHLAQCGDCREVAALSVPASVQPEPASVRYSGWLSWPTLRWAAAAACVVVVGAAVSLRHPSRPKSEETATVPAKPAQISAQSSSDNMPTALQLQSPAAKTDSVGGSGTYPSKKFAQLKAGPLDSENVSDMKTAGSAQSTEKEEADLASAAPAPATEVAAGVNLEAAVPGRAKDAHPAAQGMNSPPASGGEFAANKTSAMAYSPNAMRSALAGPPTPRWTLSSDGTLERSIDSGNSWQTIPVASQVRFRALAANGLDIWVGGSSGALYHSSDAGLSWVRVQPAANGQTLTADIIGVEFTDPQHGRVTTSGSETWVTTDAGQSWQKQ
jgi:hypothetical protein